MGNATVRELVRTVNRHKPFIVTVVAIALIAAFAPGDVAQQHEAMVTDDTSTETGTGTLSGTGAEAPEDATPQTEAELSAAAPAEDASDGDRSESQESPTTAPAEQGSSVAALDDPMEAPDCDAETGRLMVPPGSSAGTVPAPNCVPMWPDDADNGGSTYQGVTEDTITIAYYMSQLDEQTEAMLSAAGVTSSDDEARRQGRDDVIDAYESHLETYGREIEWVEVEGSGDVNDEQAARSDAIKVAEEIGAFASISSPAAGGGTFAYVDELVARGVMCIHCMINPAHWSYPEGLVWNLDTTGTGMQIHMADFLGKRVGGGPAEHAGDPALQLEDRRFGLIQYMPEDEPDAYVGLKPFLEEQMARYGLTIDAHAQVPLDPARAQEHARTVITRMQDKGITTIICWCDPLMPVFYTQEATRQQYFPEWFFNGYLMDTALFGRTYDQAQWQNAFGLSLLPAPLSPDAEDAEKPHTEIVTWHHGEEPEETPNQTSTGLFFLGVHLAGPNLTPQTFGEGLRALQPTSGMKTRLGVSFGEGRWPWSDWNAVDDITQIWWDPNAAGEDETGQYGVGMYRYMEMGQRFLPGEWPDTPAPLFEEEGTVTQYPERPEEDQLPTYERREPLREP